MDGLCPCGHPETDHYSDSEDEDLSSGFRGCGIYVHCADWENHRRSPNWHTTECHRCPCDGYWELIVEARWHGPSA